MSEQDDIQIRNPYRIHVDTKDIVAMSTITFDQLERFKKTIAATELGDPHHPSFVLLREAYLRFQDSGHVEHYNVLVDVWSQFQPAIAAALGEMCLSPAVRALLSPLPTPSEEDDFYEEPLQDLTPELLGSINCIGRGWHEFAHPRDFIITLRAILAIFTPTSELWPDTWSIMFVWGKETRHTPHWLYTLCEDILEEGFAHTATNMNKQRHVYPKDMCIELKGTSNPSNAEKKYLLTILDRTYKNVYEKDGITAITTNLLTHAE
jgi:hypothetical protein